MTAFYSIQFTVLTSKMNVKQKRPAIIKQTCYVTEI